MNVKDLHPHPILGILGGLGPYAHLLLEQRLLAAAREMVNIEGDQDFPEWILSSMPQTPDRSGALLGDGPSPLPWLLRSLRRMEPRQTADGEEIPGADFVLIPCNTAHAFLADLERASKVPLLDMIELCARHLAARLEPGARIGLLATTGTLESGIYQRALTNCGLEARTPLDAPQGNRLQAQVMNAIFGPLEKDGSRGPGLKALGHAAAESTRPLLLEVAEQLVDELGCRALVAACTEVPLALVENEQCGVPLIDPMDVVAREAILRVYGLNKPSP